MKKISTLKNKAIKVTVFIHLLVVCINSNTLANDWLHSNYKAISAATQMTGIGNLPVVLTPLIGNCINAVPQLQWSSLQESNSKHYEIQRSVDGLNFSKVGSVKAKGSSDLEVVYNYKDVSAEAGLNYYRLKLIDNDGVFQYSNIEAIDVIIAGIKITGNYPGPFTEEINVNILSAWVSPAVICLLDCSGKIIVSHQIKLFKGNNKSTFYNLGYLNRGIYYIKIQAGTTSVTQKIVK